MTWYHDTPVPHAIAGNSVNSAPYNAACAPDPGQQCIIQDGCTLEDGGGGGPAGADAEVTSTVTFPDLSGPSGYHQVCIVTDWFQEGYGYLGTDVNECWYDAN